MSRVRGDDLNALGQRALDGMFDQLGDRVGQTESHRAAEQLRARGQGVRGDVWEAGYRFLRSFEPNPRGQITAQTEGQQARGALARSLRGRTLTPAAIDRLPANVAPFVRALYALHAVANPSERASPRLIRQGVQHTLQLMKNAAGDNNLLSDRERGRLLTALFDAGRDDEARAVRYLYGMADALSSGSPDAADFNGLEARLDELVDAFDQGRPGLFDDALSPEGLALNRVGQLAQAGAVQPEVPGVAEPAGGGRVDLDARTVPGKLERLLDASRGQAGEAVPVRGADLPAPVGAALEGRLSSLETGLESVFARHPNMPANTQRSFARVDGHAGGGPETIGYRGTVEAVFPNGDGGGTGLRLGHHTDYEGNGVGLTVQGLSSLDRDPTDRRNYTGRLEATVPNLFSNERDAPYTGHEWQPDFTVSDRELTERFAADPDDPLAFLAMAARAAQIENPFNIAESSGGRREGDWKVGYQNVDGRQSVVVRWNDIDDASFAYVFEPSAGSPFNAKSWDATMYTYVN